MVILTRSLLPSLLLLTLLHFSLTTTLDQPQHPIELATLAGGCFWCVEAIFERIPGVLDVESGYSGGPLPNPTYLEVKSGQSGHAEVIRVRFNPEILSFEQLLNAFFRAHDPTTLNRQGIDVGHQYRSAIFYHDEKQKAITEKVIKGLEESLMFMDPIVTEVAPLINYYPAEDYHQDYFNTFQNDKYCTVDTADIAYKIEKFFNAFNRTMDKGHKEAFNEEQKFSQEPVLECNETVNTNPPLPTNIKIVRSQAEFHPWHNVGYGEAAPQVVVALIEITRDSRAKYEIDKKSGLLALDRLLHPDFPYPANYGFVPQTLYGDGDAMDIVVFSEVDIRPMTLVKARIIGMLTMIDNDEKDDKLLAVIDNDVSMSHVQDIEDIPGKVIESLKTYYETYKNHENIKVVIERINNKGVAHEAIAASIQLYRDLYVLANDDKNEL